MDIGQIRSTDVCTVSPMSHQEYAWSCDFIQFIKTNRCFMVQENVITSSQAD